MAETLGTKLLTYLAGPTLSQLSSLTQTASQTADTFTHTSHAATTTATTLTSLLTTLTSPISTQPSIPRSQFTRKLVAFYYDAFNHPGLPRHHVVAVYDRCARFVSFRGVLSQEGRYVEGPTEMWTTVKKVSRGKGKIGKWGYHVWVFRGEGEMELLGDGGYVNWCFRSAAFEREGKRVRFGRIN
ncbi:hypothetical protein EX30DRAFT_222277 [Ascodesmis nigricans]|uniref:Uncharacterized protein n=1 Tax=Ascodesmis nigricans TaxID=341454 RepID=A0A4S2N064_9PEZI|nr:hypothetical protein EX30DRAFT_222277 [Ascodesmis nigricans]